MAVSDDFRGQEPKQDLAQMAGDMAKLWASMAMHAADIAHSRRVLFLAYVAEGFNEQQALELVMKP